MPNVMPHNAEAERATVGAIFLDRDAIMPLAAWLKPEHFYTQALGYVYEAQLACYNRRVPPDLQTVADELRTHGWLDTIGGLPFLFELSDGVPTAYHVEYYAQIVEQSATRRMAIKQSTALTAQAYDEAEPFERVVDAAERTLTALAQQRNVRPYASFGDIADAYYAYLHLVEERGEVPSGVPSGLIDVDAMTGGWQPQDLIILAARPGVGKTALALTCAVFAAMDAGEPVGIFSLEMGKEQLFQRAIAMRTGIDTRKLRTGKLSLSELQVVTDAMHALSAAPIHVDDTGDLSVADLKSKARLMVAEQGIKLLVVDYLQLMSGSDRRSENRVQEISEISRALKLLARELNIPIIALSQLSRQVEHRTNKVPVLADLRESGSIEQDSDVVMFIYREEMHDKESDKKGIAELHIAKHRNGPLGVVSLVYEERRTLFRSLAPWAEPEGY